MGFARDIYVLVPRTSRFLALSLRSRFALRARFPALRFRNFAFRLRYLDNRFERLHARRSHDLPSEGQARPDMRVRVRRSVIRIRVRHAAIRIRVVVAAIDHTAYERFRDAKVHKMARFR